MTIRMDEEQTPKQTEEKPASEETPETQPLLEEAPPTEPATEPSKPGDPEYTKAVQRRIDQLTREKHEAKREAARVKADHDALKRKVEAGVRPVPPDPNRFMTEEGTVDHGKYQQAVVDYEDKLHTWRQAQVVTPTDISPAEASPPQELVSTFLERVETLKQKHADYDAVINRPVFTPVMRDAIFGSEHGPELAYYLGKNEKEAMRIGSLEPAQLFREIGKLEARFSAESGRRSVSGAPEPITPVTGNATVTKDPEKMTTAEWMAHERAQKLEKLKKQREAFGG